MIQRVGAGEMALDAWTLNPRDNRERSEKSQVRREIELFQVPGFGRRSGLDLGNHRRVLQVPGFVESRRRVYPCLGVYVFRPIVA